MTETAKLSLPLVELEAAEGQAKDLLEGARKQLGMVPNMYAEMANFAPLLDTYLHGYDLLRRKASLSQAEQELVFLVISRENECTYCVAAHSMIAHAVSKTPEQAIRAVRDDTPIEDATLKALADFTRIMVASRGNPSEHDVAAFCEVGYTQQNVLEIILAIAVKTISNYTNHLFHSPVDERFKQFAWSPVSP